MRAWILLGLVGWAIATGDTSPREKNRSSAGDTSPTLYYDAARHTLVVGPVEQEGEVVEVLNVIGQRVALLNLQEPAADSGRLVVLSLPTLPPGLYYARWLREGQIHLIRRFSVT